MDKEEAHDLLVERSKSCILTSKHCRDRMVERDVLMDDIRNVIHWGKVISIEWSQEYENWKCLVSGKDMEEESLKLVAAILEDSILCITVED